MHLCYFKVVTLYMNVYNCFLLVSGIWHIMAGYLSHIICDEGEKICLLILIFFSKKKKKKPPSKRKTFTTFLRNSNYRVSKFY